ncbi:MAG: hypothetical protein WBF77_03860 [Sulfurimonadaceae bacterium]
MANVLVYAPFATWQPHFETDLELGKKFADEEHQVSFYFCDGSLPTCAPNISHSFLTCQMCKARSQQGIKWLNKTFDINVLPSFSLSKEELIIINNMINKNFTTIEEVKSLEFEGCDIGMAALSSVISYLREPKPSLEKHQDALKKNIQTAMTVYFSMKKTLTEGNFDRLILFNGRFSALRPALRVARQMGIEVIVHERGTYLNEYSLTKNTYPHDINYIYQQLIDIKQNIPVDTYETVGGQWFEERISGQQQNWKSFIEEQKAGKIPKELQTDALKIAIFNSSEDEFEAIEEWKNPYYKTQNEGLVQILHDCQHLNVQFLLRVHPNLKGIDNSQTQELVNIKHKNKDLVFIDANSDISTYDLIKHVDLVIAFGSTVGIEAAYIGQPVCVMGKTPYDVLDACIKPKSHQHLIKIITNLTQGIKPAITNNDSTVYGFWQKTKSTPLIYTKQTDIFEAYLLESNEQVSLNRSPQHFIYYILQTSIVYIKKKLKCWIKLC